MSLLEKDQYVEAIEVLLGFIEQVHGLSPVHLSPEQASGLIATAEMRIELIEMTMDA